MGIEALIEAARTGDAGRVGELLEAEPHLKTARGADGLSPLLHAVYRGHTAVVDTLLAAGAPLDSFEAAAVGRAEGVTGDVNAFSQDGWTPLHLAVFFGHPECARVLLDRGADHALVSCNGMGVTPLQSALARKQVECAELLLDRGADVNGEPGENWSPLHYCAAHGMPEIARRLLAAGADANRKNLEGQTPLELAGKDTEVAALLRQHGAV
jgi:uncharacterized protein